MLILAGQIQAQADARGSQAAPWSVPAYVAELDRLSAFLETATVGEAIAISRSLAPRWIVDTGTERVAVDASWLLAGLRQAGDAGEEWPSVRERLRRRLLAMGEHAAGAGTVSGALHGNLRAAVQDVLARPEFQQSAGARWREALQQRIGAWIESFFSRIGIGGVSGRLVATTLAWVAALAPLVGLGIWLARTLAAGSRAVSIGMAPGDRHRLSAREWALRAVAALRAGNAREAVRCAYNGALRRLEDDGVWRIDQARTPREYLRLLPAGDSRGPAVRELTALFEQVWYGNRGIGAADASRVGANLESLGCLHAADRAI